MSGYRVMHWSLCCLAVAMAFAGCTSDTTSSETTGSLSLNLEIGNIEIDAVDYLITGKDTAEGGTIDTSAPGSTASVEVFGLLPGDYTVTLSATATDDETMCEGSEDFPIEADELTPVMVYLRCKLPETLGGVRVNGKFNVCAVVNESVVKPLQTSVGNDIDLSAMGEDAEGDEIAYLWTGTGGSIDEPMSMNTTYTCEEAGEHEVTIEVSDDGSDYCKDSWTTVVTCVGGDGLDCIDDEDCDAGEICLNNKCVPDVECNDDQDCDTGFVCENFECVSDVECNENDDCDLGDICFENVCRADPDLFCDTGLCVEDTELRGECVEKFLLCLADEVDEEECVLLSIALCTECNTGLDCGDDNECTDNVCTAGVCSNPNNDNMCNDGAGLCFDGACNIVDLCQGVSCEDTECTDGVCDPSNGDCVDKPINEGNTCTVDSPAMGATYACDDGECIGTFCDALFNCETTENNCACATDCMLEQVCNPATGCEALVPDPAELGNACNYAYRTCDVTSLNSFDTCTVDSDCSVTSHCRDVPATACDSDYDCDPSNGNPPLGDVCVGDGNGTCDNTQAGFCEDNGLCVFQGACTDPTNLGTICSPAWPALIEQCAGATTTGLPVQPPWLPDWPVAAACSGNATCTGACLEANSPADKACADCYGATTGITGTACVLAPGNGQWCFPVGLGGTCGPGCPACEKCITGHGIYRDQFVCTGDTTAGCL